MIRKNLYEHDTQLVF